MAATTERPAGEQGHTETAPTGTAAGGTTKPVTEGKTADGTTPAAGSEAQKEPGSKPADAAAAPAAAAVPEKYELKIPDGGSVDADDLKLVETRARKLGLSNENAQALLEEFDAERVALSAQFRAVTEADPDYGGDKLPETQELADLVLDHYRPAGSKRGDALRRIFEKTGLNNHLELISLLADIGRDAKEDRLVRPGNAKPVPKTPQEALYGPDKT